MQEPRTCPASPSRTPEVVRSDRGDATVETLACARSGQRSPAHPDVRVGRHDGRPPGGPPAEVPRPRRGARRRGATGPGDVGRLRGRPARSQAARRRRSSAGCLRPERRGASGREHARHSCARPPADPAALRGAQLRGDLGRGGLDKGREPAAERILARSVLGQDVARDAIAPGEREQQMLRVGAPLTTDALRLLYRHFQDAFGARRDAQGSRAARAAAPDDPLDRLANPVLAARPRRRSRRRATPVPQVLLPSNGRRRRWRPTRASPPLRVRLPCV
jgi:hypothetical protein